MALPSEGKLVRDLIPDVVTASGRQPITETISDTDLIDALRHKVVEEVQELFNADSSGRVEEMADVLEVLRGMALAVGVEWEAIEEVARVKRRERGGFEGGIWLREIKSP